jgi:hypothetical protein
MLLQSHLTELLRVLQLTTLMLRHLDLPYTSAAKGSLVVTSNTKLTSLSADKVDGLATFTLTGNSDLNRYFI